MNEKYKLKITTLTPVFIGSGENNNIYMEFYLKEGKAKHINFKKFLYSLEDNVLNKFIEEVKRGVNLNFINNYSNFIKEEHIDYEIENFSNSLQAGKSRNVSLIIKTNNKTYIPGSSLKGAIRTTFNDNVYGQKIIVRDSDTSNEIALYDVYTLSKEGKGVSNIMEMIKPNQEFETIISLNDITIEEFKKKINENMNEDIEKMYSQIDEKIEKFENNGKMNSVEILENLSSEINLLEKKRKDFDIILRIGFGSIRGTGRMKFDKRLNKKIFIGNKDVILYGGWTKFVEKDNKYSPIGWIGINVCKD